MIGERTVAERSALVLASPAPGGLEAAFVPDAGMVGCSLRHRGAELLGLRGGLGAYVAERATMGIPLLYPWANRLGRERFTLAGRDVVLDSISPPLRVDGNGLPMHGLLAGVRGWRVERHEDTADGAVLATSFDFGDGLTDAFPFPHDLSLEAEVRGEALTISTTVRASRDAPVPIAFGFHPYLRLPGVDRRDWEIDVPVRERLCLDERMLPTGEREPVALPSGALGTRVFDDAYVAPEGPFVLAGGGRRIELAFVGGFPYAQVFAPAEDDVVAFEPMTAPTNALVDAGPELRVLAPGDSYQAAFSITVTDTAG